MVSHAPLPLLTGMSFRIHPSPLRPQSPRLRHHVQGRQRDASLTDACTLPRVSPRCLKAKLTTCSLVLTPVCSVPSVPLLSASLFFNFSEICLVEVQLICRVALVSAGGAVTKPRTRMHILSHCGLPQAVEHRPLGYTVGSCSFTLYMRAFIC